MPVQDLQSLEYKLGKRGFRKVDLYLHECPACKERAVITYGILGKSGGRDIKYCQACGVAKSWRNGAGMEEREEDPTFDLDAFLK